MARKNRRSTRDLIEEITKDGSHFGFFQAVRLLALSSNESEVVAIPSNLRFGSPLTLAFPPSEIVDMQARPRIPQATPNDPTEEEAKITNENDALSLLLTVAFMGLTGPSAALPTSYTELLIERQNTYRDTAAHRFLDIFTHRAVSLFYNAWRKHRFYIGYESGERDHFTRNMLDLLGVGLAPLQARLQQSKAGIPDVFLTHFAGLLSQKPVSATNIAALVRGYFRVNTEVEQFVGQWIPIPLEDQTCLGKHACKLGQDAFAGERIWDRQNKIRIKLGPLNDKQFADFLPGQAGAIAIKELVQFCVGQSLACDITLCLDKSHVSMPKLSNSHAHSPRLGYNTWLHTHRTHVHPEDAQFCLLK